MSKEPTRYQLSSRLSYTQTTPSFLKRLQNQVAGVADDEDEEDGNEYNENWQSSSGRPPIPRRPTPPQRPDDEHGSADEDDDDERPQIVVLKEGKHLSSLEVENEKRRAKGLPPLQEQPDISEPNVDNEVDKNSESKQIKGNSLSFSSTGKASGSRKRKAVGDALDAAVKGHSGKFEKKTKKKARKTGALLSFDEGNDG